MVSMLLTSILRKTPRGYRVSPCASSPRKIADAKSSHMDFAYNFYDTDGLRQTLADAGTNHQTATTPTLLLCVSAINRLIF